MYAGKCQYSTMCSCNRYTRVRSYATKRAQDPVVAFESGYTTWRQTCRCRPRSLGDVDENVGSCSKDRLYTTTHHVRFPKTAIVRYSPCQNHEPNCHADLTSPHLTVLPLLTSDLPIPPSLQLIVHIARNIKSHTLSSLTSATQPLKMQ